MGNVAQLCTYARMDTIEVPFTGDLLDAWEDPASFFLLSSEQRTSDPVSSRIWAFEAYFTKLAAI